MSLLAWALALSVAMAAPDANAPVSDANAEVTTPSTPDANALVPTASPTPTQEANGSVDYDAAEPPPTAYDQLGKPGQPTLAPESFAMVHQLGRVLVALLFTLTLIYLFFRLGLPRVMRLWLRQGEQTYQVRERLALDSSNTLVRVEHESGMQYVLGLSSAGIQLIDKLPAPPGGPLSSPSRRSGSFGEFLRPEDPDREM